MIRIITLLSLPLLLVSCRTSVESEQPDGAAASAPARLVKVGLGRRGGPDDKPLSVPAAFIDAAGCADVGNRFQGLGEVDSVAVVSGGSLLSASDEQLVAFGIIECVEREGRHYISAILKTKVPVRFVTPGWHVVDLKIDGADRAPGVTIDRGRHEIDVVVEAEE